MEGVTDDGAYGLASEAWLAFAHHVLILTGEAGLTHVLVVVELGITASIMLRVVLVVVL